MKFARIVFVMAGVWGIVVVTPLYFLHDVTGQPYAAPTLYPHFFYGFLSVTMAWQIAFLIIGTDPVRFRPLMPAAMVEKFFYIAAMAALYLQGRQTLAQFAITGSDMIFGTLFVISYLKTASATR